MKSSIVLSFSVLALLLSIPTAVKASQPGAPRLNVAINTNLTNKISPFELVNRAYQGAYRAQGIPGFARLRYEFSIGRITAADLVAAAVEARDLSPQMQTDLAYVNAVDTKLFSGRN